MVPNSRPKDCVTNITRMTAVLQRRDTLESTSKPATKLAVHDHTPDSLGNVDSHYAVQIPAIN